MDTDATVLIAKNPRYKNLIHDSNKRESWNPAYNKRGSKNPNAVRKTLNRESNNQSYNKRGSKNPNAVRKTLNRESNNQSYNKRGSKTPRSARKTQNPESDDNLFAGSELPPSTWGVTGPRASEPLPLIESTTRVKRIAPRRQFADARSSRADAKWKTERV
eukprot:332588_1